MRACPSCGLQLPDFARYCARCGQKLPGEPALRTSVPPAWLLVLFLLGTVLTCLVAVAYAVVLASPDLPATQAGVNPPALRVTAAVITVVATALFSLQMVATIGLVRRRRWARLTATIACVAWALTCVGIPFSVLALNALWRSGAAEPPKMRQ